MPSLLTDENVPVSSQQIHPSRYEPKRALEVINEKSPRLPPPDLHTQHSNASFDDTTVNSTSNSEGSDNGQEQSSPTSMTTLPNGVLDGGPDEGGQEIVGKEPPNGSSVARPPERTAPRPPQINGVRRSDSSDATARDAQPKTSLSSNGGGSLQQSPVEMSIRPAGREDVSTVNNFASSQSRSTPPAGAARGPALDGSSTVSVSMTAPSPDFNQQQQQHPSLQRTSHSPHSPHRFSSPPVYHASGATSSTFAQNVAGPSSGLAPPGVLKHRHTLEVPKLAPARVSRDGADSALATGRFSPTTATTPGGRRASLSMVRRNTRSIHSDLPRDEVVPDEDALRWAEAYRQKRASKRKKREETDDDRVLVGTKVDESHANWVMAYNMLTGIRVSVSRTNAKLDRPLTDADFETKQKSTFDIAGNELVPSAKYDFKFKDYAPWVFRHLRALFRLDPADYLMSLTGKYILSELGSPGKSGSFFYFSRDYKYIIKTIHHTEHKFLRKILRQYYQHVTDNPNTLLSQFYGLHRVKIPYGKKIHFVVMNNLFPPHLDIHQTFDLKGSTIGRNYKEEDLEKNPRATMKDLNWLRRHQHLELGMRKKQLFLEQLQKDVGLLQRLEIMDYSLLVGIHDQERGNHGEIRSRTLKIFNPGGGSSSEDHEPQSVLMRTPSKLENARKARELRQMLKAERPMPMGQAPGNHMPDELDEGRSRPGFVFYEDDGGFRATHEDNSAADEIYYLGVIDCLTHYGMIKKIESFWKGLSKDRKQISALPPDQYGERFLNFISATTMSAEESARERQEREAAEVVAASNATPATHSPHEKSRVASWGSGRWRAGGALPASISMPTHPPPLPPTVQSPPLPSGEKSPEVEETLQRAERVAQQTDGTHEEDVPERILKTTSMPAAVAVPPIAGATIKQHSANNGPSDRRESVLGGQPPILPIVEEVGESSSIGTTGERNGVSASSKNVGEGGLGVGTRSMNGSERASQTESNSSDGRPLTPAKDGAEVAAGFGNPIISSASSPKGRPPPTPPKTGYGSPKSASRRSGHLKPDSADSGYGVTGSVLGSVSGSQRSQDSTMTAAGSRTGRMRSQVSRESLDKALPPLPKTTQRIDENGDRVTRIGIS